MTTMQLEITALAAQQAKQLMSQSGKGYFRISVHAGGCSGFQYSFSMDEQSQEKDIQIQDQEVTVVIDPVSAPYLDGSILDYKEDLTGAQFFIKNPKADATCSCGVSFSIGTK